VHLWSGGGVLDTVKVKAESLALTYSAVNEVMLKKISLSFSSLSDRVVAGACVCRGGVPANSGISAEACCSRERSRNRLLPFTLCSLGPLTFGPLFSLYRRAVWSGSLLCC